MVKFANIVCKGVGALGMSAVLYDAYKVGSRNAVRVSQEMQADHFEKVHRDTRTLPTESAVTGAMQKKISKMRNNNPIVPIVGNIKGFIGGVFNSLGDNLIPVALSSLALCTKGFFSKVGAIGVAGFGLFTVLKEGFGVGKTSPIDKG